MQPGKLYFVTEMERSAQNIIVVTKVDQREKMERLESVRLAGNLAIGDFEPKFNKGSGKNVFYK
ncbi:hypothetical protein BVY04_00945 [bacterium M21]|nr:hypothetical protein BVY04_00945 [bacterium M21]